MAGNPLRWACVGSVPASPEPRAGCGTGRTAPHSVPGSAALPRMTGRPSARDADGRGRRPRLGRAVRHSSPRSASPAAVASGTAGAPAGPECPTGPCTRPMPARRPPAPPGNGCTTARHAGSRPASVRAAASCISRRNATDPALQPTTGLAAQRLEIHAKRQA